MTQRHDIAPSVAPIIFQTKKLSKDTDTLIQAVFKRYKSTAYFYFVLVLLSFLFVCLIFT